MVFVAYNYDGYVTSIVNAIDSKLANAYWQGAGIDVHMWRSLDDETEFAPLKDHPTGVYPILKTEYQSYSDFRDMKFGAKVLVIKK